jgi:hypothetical protein
MSTERETTADDFRQSLFAKVQSVDEALSRFRTGVGEHPHVCDQPGGCRAVVTSFPFCYLLAYTAAALHLGKSGSTEQVERESMEDWFRIGYRSVQGTSDEALRSELSDLNLEQ